jgi:hypothetical protein
MTNTVRQGVDLRVLALRPIDPTQTRQGVLPVDIHRARAADSLSARTAEGESRIDLVFYLYESIENHGPRLVEVD